MNLEKIITTALLVPLDHPNNPKCYWGLNLLLWGEPGIGKSDRVVAAAAQAGLPSQVVYAPTCQPEDMAGAAFPDGKGNITIEPLVPGIRQLLQDGQGVLFIDELSCARPAVQAAFLGVALARKVGDKKLPPGIRIIGAANPPESAAGGWELEPPMANRFCHIDVPVPPIEDWRRWLMTEASPTIEVVDVGEQKVRDKWDEAWSHVKGLLDGFMGNHRGAGFKEDEKKKDFIPTALHYIPKEGSKHRGRAWPSPRTWWMAGRAMATCICLDMDREVMSLLVEGCIGEGPATEFFAWIREANLPPPITVLTKGWQPNRTRIDLTHAVYAAMTSFVINTNDKKEREKYAVLAWRQIAALCDSGMNDIALHFSTMLVKVGLDSKSENPDIIKASGPVMIALAKGGYGKFVTGNS